MAEESDELAREDRLARGAASCHSGFRAEGRMELGHAQAILRTLILVSAANGAPVLFARLLGIRFAHSIDGGMCCVTAILCLVAPRRGVASPQPWFSRPAP